MALVPKLDLRQSQSLVMTNQLQQAIKLLQLSNVELEEYVNQEIEKNPLLEKEEDFLQTKDIEDKNIDEFVKTDDENKEKNELINEENSPDVEIDNSFGDSHEETVSLNEKDEFDYNMSLSSVGSSTTSKRTDFSNNLMTVEDNLSKQTSLRDEIINQITLDMPDKKDRIVALSYMEMLDEAGYLQGDVDDVVNKLNCSKFRAEDVLWQLQQFSPAGIFARGLKECLELQLKDKGIYDEKFKITLDNLDLLAKKEYVKLKKKLDVGNQALKEIIEDIKELNPKPAIGFETESVQGIIPDVFIFKKADGSWHVELNQQTLPRVLINNDYKLELESNTPSKEVKKFISENTSSANWLMKILHQRANTILKVSAEILRRQEDFFERGIEFLRPMVLRDIAEEILMHESTVSRVVNNKYMSTPKGVFELKYFFSQGLSSVLNQDGLSSQSVKHKIKTLIEKETPKKVLSDDKIVKLLQEEGVKIARRTVAKYREAMKIPSSAVRKREKRNLL